MLTPASPRRASGRLAEGLAVQQRVIGALVLRELHTRFGRSNIGYLWMIGEPLMLATVIGMIHAAQGSHNAASMPGVPFGILGYCIYIIFRGIFGRSEGAVEGNQSLLYHRSVQILDVLIAKAIIEVFGCTCTLFILLGLCLAFGFAQVPPRPLLLLAAILLMAWWSMAMGMLVVGFTYNRHSLGRLVHPISYFSMPLSGMLVAQQVLPPVFRDVLAWNPMVHIFELARYGFFASASDKYIDLPYVLGWNAFLTYWGLLAIRRVRRRLTLH